MNDNKLPHNWHDTTLYSKQEDKIPLSAWFGAAVAVGALFLACLPLRIIMDHIYTPSNATDIEKGWREKLYYVRASEQPDIKAKHEMYKRFNRDTSKDDNGQP
jgi:hypothetical protein